METFKKIAYYVVLPFAVIASIAVWIFSRWGEIKRISDMNKISDKLNDIGSKENEVNEHAAIADAVFYKSYDEYRRIYDQYRKNGNM